MKFAGMLLAASSLMLVSGAAAVNAQEQPRPVLIYDYAVDHPTDDVDLPAMPTIGASVPHNVVVSTAEGEETVYGYFYYQGRPVIVDLSTRSVVRVGN